MQRVKIIFPGEVACFLQTGDKFRPWQYVFYCEPWIATGITGFRQSLADIDILLQFGVDQLSGLLKALSLCSFGFAEKAVQHSLMQFNHFVCHSGSGFFQYAHQDRMTPGC